MSCQRSENFGKGAHSGRKLFRAVVFKLKQWYPFIHFVFLEVPGNKRSILVEVEKEHWELHQQAVLS